MKRALSVLLTLSLLLGCLTCAASAADTADLRIAVASDLHYNLPREEIAGPEIGAIDDPLFWYANRRAAMEDESGFIIDEFLRQCAEGDCEYVLIPGDLADNGRRLREEHETVAAKLAAFERESGKQVFVIDGNHDIGKAADDTKMADFKEIYADFGYDRALTVSETDCSYTADLGSKYRLIALDSCDYGKSTEDGMTAAKLNFVRREAKNAKRDGRYPIVMMHHNLLDHMPMQRIINRNFIVRFHRTTASLFADWGVRVVLSGHEHCSDASSFTSAAGNKIYDFANTSLTMYPLAYRTMSFADDTITYETVNLRSIDADALSQTVKGYSEEQLAAMREDVNAYAKGFLKAGVQYRLWLSMTMEKMGVKESDFYFDAVNTVFARLNELLAMPLYGEGSLRELADSYNIRISESSYKTAWDLATDLVAMHYAGEEAFGVDSTEVTAFLRIINAVLHDDLARFGDEILLKSANALLKKEGAEGLVQTITRTGTHIFGSVTPGEYFLLVLIAPFLYEFAYDTDGVNDSRGTIEGYAVHANVRNIVSNIGAFFRILLDYIRNFFTLTYTRLPFGRNFI